MAAADATTGGDLEHQLWTPSPDETFEAQTKCAPANPGIEQHTKTTMVKSGGPGHTLASGAKDREIVQLQRSLTETKTSTKAKEIQLRIAREELHNSREALNKSFAEYSYLREQLKTVKQALGREHQATVYRKDIELFALRKDNEKKDKHILERDARLEEMKRQHRATVEIKDAQLKVLQERIVLMEHHANPNLGQETDEGAHALKVRLLRVKKGRNSLEGEEDKDVVISSLEKKLEAATKIAEAVGTQQAELQRAWDIAKKMQNAFKDERDLHIKTREQLHEVRVKLSEEEQHSKSRPIPPPYRLPTIDEDGHDRHELEAMFDTAQEDNLRLYAEIDALVKRLRDANERMFAAMREAEDLREQLRIQQAANSDLESARPSVVHPAHFRRVQSQLKDTQSALGRKDSEVEILRNTIVEKDHYVKHLQGEVDAAVSFHTQDQDEIDRLNQVVTELQKTKAQPIPDHERHASQRPHPRVIMTERTSARSSGTTLIQELSPPLTRLSNDVEALPTTREVAERERNNSIQLTPKRHLRPVSMPTGPPTRCNLINNDVPPPELREMKGDRRRSWGVREMVRKIVGKDADGDVAENSTEMATEKDTGHMRSAITPRDQTLSIRRKNTLAPLIIKPILHDTAAPYTPTISPFTQSARPANPRIYTPTTPRYYAVIEEEKSEDRPITASTGEAKSLGSRWGATNKVKRRSLY
ncbi:hypothetical protein EJ02DRAFT_425767 [Clathrospora elynae]|uniref:Uncharacterized protein n=1 Tax=Clathrospora elynae TaxID=706981 RepID=A0A6A5SIL2_9PLEO|nr:hypothetical protein EJ02DRAFT_425767 [Clathrospora elynae]